MPTAAKNSPIKYTDKSAGQPDLVPVFDALKKNLSDYVKGDYVVKTEREGIYEIYYNKKVEVEKRIYQTLPFASLMIQLKFVGFCFFPVYLIPELKDNLSPGLHKCLKGKNCFHIKKNDRVLFEQVNKALQAGYDAYKLNGWK